MAAVSELVDQNDTKPDRNSESEVTNEDSSDNTIIGSISGNNTTNSRHDLSNSHPKTAGKNLDSVGKFNICNDAEHKLFEPILNMYIFLFKILFCRSADYPTFKTFRAKGCIDANQQRKTQGDLGQKDGKRYQKDSSSLKTRHTLFYFVFLYRNQHLTNSTSKSQSLTLTFFLRFLFFFS